MKEVKTAWYAAALFFLSMLLTACMAGQRLDAVAADPAAVSGTYTILLHGCNYSTQIDNVAILADEQSPYPIDIYDIPTSYTVKKNIPAKEALEAAMSFIPCSTYRVWKTRFSRITDDSGKTIGYEVRPLYLPLEFGNSDPLQISYFLLKDGVRVYIRIDSTVEKKLSASGDRGSSGHSR
jgi:hypothetical protein